MASIDEQLLSAEQADRQRQEEMAMADKLRQERMGAEDRERQNEPRSLREKVQSARQALDIKEKAKEKLKEKVAAPASMATGSILRWAWLTLIPSWGLSLIYINLHVFLRFVLGEKLFCKLGEEWIPKQISAAGGEAGKMAGRSVGIVEAMGLAMLDLAALFIILSILGIIVMIVDFMQAGVLEQISTIIGGLTKLSWSGIKALFNLFAQ